MDPGFPAIRSKFKVFSHYSQIEWLRVITCVEEGAPASTRGPLHARAATSLPIAVFQIFWREDFSWSIFYLHHSSEGGKGEVITRSIQISWASWHTCYSSDRPVSYLTPEPDTKQTPRSRNLSRSLSVYTAVLTFHRFYRRRSQLPSSQSSFHCVCKVFTLQTTQYSM